MDQSIFSIDVEDWFNLSGTGFEPPPETWGSFESRIERNFTGMLDLLSAHGGTATCFFVGYFARRFPHLVREAATRGHEVASHGFYHRLAFELTAEEFERDARDARTLLEDLAQAPVRGFRAPAFSVTPNTPWFFDRLIAAGYAYDSSVFPASHQTGGLPGAPFAPYRVRPELVELPITVVQVFGKPMCFFGGGYLRLFPYPLMRAMSRLVHAQERPLIFYVHPRELDPGQPRMPLSRKRRFTSYVNLRSTRGKIARILHDYHVKSFQQYLETQGTRIPS